MTAAMPSLLDLLTHPERDFFHQGRELLAALPLTIRTPVLRQLIEKGQWERAALCCWGDEEAERRLLSLIHI